MPSLVNPASMVSVNVLSRSLIKNLKLATPEVHQEVACLLGGPGSAGVRRDAEDGDAAGGVFDDEQHGQPLKQQCVDAEEVGGENPVGLGGQKASPGGAAAARSGVDAGSLQDQPHRAGRKLIAEPGEFALDSSVTPG